MTAEKHLNASPNPLVKAWVEEMSSLCEPASVYWCDGSEEESVRLTELAVRTGALEPLNQAKLPGCYFHRSHEDDVARTEHLTFICTPQKEDVGPTNNWMEPSEAYAKLREIFKGSMAGRTLYVVPFVMGPAGSPFSKVGVQVTDSVYVVLNMRIMTRMGNIAWQTLGESNDFTRCLHGLADLDVNRRYICHFPQDNTIWSVGSGYGGNALLGKKCLALRIASYLGKHEGWLAEHMLILGLEDPAGNVTYVAAAFPSACGKTNLAMLIPPESQSRYRVWTVGDDIAWMRVGEDGRLWAVNPEAGFFGVAPGTSYKSNPNAMRTIQKNSIYTNVAKKPDGTVWWEGMDEEPPAEALDWRGKTWTPASPSKAAHPNARFTAPAAQCPSISREWQNPRGVPISAIVFGSRRSRLAPLVYESKNWQHGTFIGSSMASETTAAAQGPTGVTRRDPMAMLPFCGYHVGDYFQNWLTVGKRLQHAPKIFHVNWFRRDQNGDFLWPGFGENIRVLRWIVERTKGAAGAVDSTIGYLPAPGAIDLSGLNLPSSAAAQLLAVDREGWLQEVAEIEEFYGKIGDRLPAALRQELNDLKDRLKSHE
ncbi:MAG: phosphoenolpyruvate carboxykinase (GTP) [Candidatus Omnitrophica bacterium]|nr:phosphoenolpyruvate carboxykinase (GTP) [Candidatus Omnitrophota bacterium]